MAVASHNTFTSFGMAKHLSDILYNAVIKCITRDIGMGNYEKQGKQEAAYPIPISLPPMPQQFFSVRSHLTSKRLAVLYFP